jgi:hypothetical protein
MNRMRVFSRRLVLVVLCGGLAGCALLEEGTGSRRPRSRDEPPPPLPVQKAGEEVIVAAWAEPARLPPAGGQAQVLVRVQKRGGAPYPGVQVRLRSSPGTLFSEGKVLVSDAAGQTRDRLAARETSWITVNAGGTVYRFRVPVGAVSDE